MECDVVDSDISSLSLDDSVVSESSAGQRLEILVDKATRTMKTLLITEGADEREGLHAEIMADMSEAAALMNILDSKRLQNVADYILSPNCRLQVIYSFLRKCFASEYYRSRFIARGWWVV